MRIRTPASPSAASRVVNGRRHAELVARRQLTALVDDSAPVIAATAGDVGGPECVSRASSAVVVTSASLPCRRARRLSGDVAKFDSYRQRLATVAQGLPFQL